MIVDDNNKDEEMEDGNQLSSIDKSKDSESEMSVSESEQESSDDDNQAIDVFVMLCAYITIRTLYTSILLHSKSKLLQQQTYSCI